MQWACPSVRLSVCRQNTKKRFSQKVSNLQVWCLLTTYRKSYVGFQGTHYWTPKIKNGEDLPSWKLRWHHFFCWGWSDFDKILQTAVECHINCVDIAEIETESRIPIWRTFGPIQWHVIPEAHATLQGVRIPPYWKSSFAIFYYFCFLNAVWALTSSGFGIVSDTLVLSVQRCPIAVGVSILIDWLMVMVVYFDSRSLISLHIDFLLLS